MALQHEYAEALQSIDARMSERMATLSAKLEMSQSHNLPPSYPPSDVESAGEVGRSMSNPEMVETDPECNS